MADTAATVALVGVLTARAAGPVADTDAESVTSPASTSAWVTVWLPSALQVIDAPGAIGPLGQFTGPDGSATASELRFTFPVFATVN